MSAEVHSSPAAWARLLPGDTPCGEDCGFDEAFEALRAEVGMDTSVHATRATNWIAVLEMTDSILARSKDVWALSYGVVALLRTRGLPDAAGGIAVLADLLDAFWDSLYPLPGRIQRRMAPLAWLHEHLRRYAEASRFAGESRDSLTALAASLERLQTVLDQRLAEHALAFAALLPAMEIPAPASVPNAAASPAPPPDPVIALDSDGRIPATALPQVLRAGTDNIRQLGDHLLALNIDDERGYLLHRAACWGTLLHMPAAAQDRRTQLECSVPDDIAASYADAVESRRFAEILPALERSAAKAPFWFDGHHLVARCLEGMEATAALSCVHHALVQLVGRFPDLLSLAFKNGKPFATPSTLAWAESLVQAPLAGLPSAPGHGVLLSPGDFADEELRLREAIDMFPEKGFRAGLRHLGSVPPGRTRAAARHGLAQARYCAATGNKPAAARILSALYARLEAWNLLDWEPELTTAVLSLLLSSQPRSKRGATDEMINALHWYNLDAAFVVFTEP